MKYLITEKQLKNSKKAFLMKEAHNNTMQYVLRRVDWEEVLIALKNGIKFAERRYRINKDNWNAMNLKKYSLMVMSVLMDHIHNELSDGGKFEFPYNEIFDLFSKLFYREINNSYNRVKQ